MAKMYGATRRRRGKPTWELSEEDIVKRDRLILIGLFVGLPLIFIVVVLLQLWIRSQLS